ncbi:CASC3/Barentsz eIF4AIII binding, putative isoform 3 [Melia azedarach]|nr:CASC3/Barentsz eIF4AIII binding, putative isoform 3 [Melia azedarach]KAJ4708397.1 CASC3/Barentsz eIF4AIII binding, putative isoform 3 [Melia azedarach]
MADLVEEQKVGETEYKSESEESFSELATRRKNASDDDDDNGNTEGEARERFVRTNRRFRAGYGHEPDGPGRYDEDDAILYENENKEPRDEQLEGIKEEEDDDDSEENEFEDTSCGKEGAKQQKENESEVPVDPIIGSFYMHDDRFRGRGLGPSRWILDESFRAIKDEQKWKHDKFEEMKAWDSSLVEVRRNSEQYHRGHPKNKGEGKSHIKANWYKVHDSFNNQSYSSKVVRGRGPIKYKPIRRSSNVNPPTEDEQSRKPQGQTSNTSSIREFSTKYEQYLKTLVMPSSAESERKVSTKKKSGNFVEKTSNSDSVRVPSQISNVVSDSLASEKHVFAANTSSASQMFNSSNPSKLDSVTQKKEMQPVKAFGYFPTSALLNHNVNVPQCNSLLQGKIRANPIGCEKLYSGNLICPASEKFVNNLPMQSSISWPTYTIASPQIMGQRGLPFSTMLTHQFCPTCNQVSSLYPLVQQPIVQQMLVETMIKHPLEVLTQDLNECSGTGAQASSEALLPISYVPGTLESLQGSGRGINTLHGRGLLTAETQNDQKFTATAALFPAMRQGRQDNADCGDPAVNMAISRYIARSQNGFGNPEITWLPGFPEAAGTVGSAYHSPYVIADGGYIAHSTGELPCHHVTR